MKSQTNGKKYRLAMDQTVWVKKINDLGEVPVIAQQVQQVQVQVQVSQPSFSFRSVQKWD